MHLWAIRAGFGGVRNLLLEIKWFSPPERCINHLELPYLLDLVDRQLDGVVYLTLEPHLKLFGTYAAIDQHDLKGKYQFATNDESFDFAANALKDVLKKLGFSENDQHQWVRNV